MEKIEILRIESLSRAPLVVEGYLFKGTNPTILDPWITIPFCASSANIDKGDFIQTLLLITFPFLYSLLFS